MPGFATAGLLLRKDLIDSGAYKTLADLKGRKIAMAAPGTASTTSTARALATVGLTIKDVELVYLSFPNMVTGLQNKAVAVRLESGKRLIAETVLFSVGRVGDTQKLNHPAVLWPMTC